MKNKNSKMKKETNNRMKTASLLRMKTTLLLLCFIVACGNDEQPDRLTEFNRALIAACPVVDPASVAERDACGEALASLPIFDEVAPNILAWGGQPEGFTAEDLLTEASLTDLDPHVWRKMYLSTFMFPDAPMTVEKSGNYRTVRIPVQFRFDLPAGDYPYPFWHSQGKWTSYQTATDIIFVVDQKDHILAGARSATKDPSKPQRDRTWDGIWQWDNGNEPRVALYSYLFSAVNPHVPRLEAAYRTLEEGLREHDCTRCHDPANTAGAKRLEIFNYPNQALTARREAVRQVELGVMPPALPPNTPAGIEDLEARLDLVRRAREFADAGDAAFAFETLQ